MPLPNTRVIGDDWSQHHRPTAVGQLTATGRIIRPASGAAAVFNESTGRSVAPSPTTVYGPGPIRVQRLPQAVSDSTTGDREQTIREYQVTVDFDRATTPLAVNDIAIVDVSPDDPHLVGRALRVRDVRLGTLAWQRDLLCEDVAPTTR